MYCRRSDSLKFKICKSCKRKLPATTEYFHKDRKYLKSECKECRAKNRRDRTEKGYDSKGAWKRRYYGDKHDEILEYKRKYNRKYYADHRKKILEQRKNNRLKATIKQKENASNRYKKYLYSKAAEEIGVKSDFSVNDWNNCKKYFDNKCAYCGKDTKNLCQDHLIPRNKNGAYTCLNIVPSCASCNSKKQDNDWEEWYKAQPFYSNSRYNRIKKYINTVS